MALTLLIDSKGGYFRLPLSGIIKDSVLKKSHENAKTFFVLKNR